MLFILVKLNLKDIAYFRRKTDKLCKKFWDPQGYLESLGGFKFQRRRKMEEKIYVGNLPFGASEDDLRNLFLQAGEVKSVKIITDQYSGRSRGFGFIEMTSQADAEKAISLLNGKTLMGQTLVVNKARPQKKRGGNFKGRRGRNR